GYAKWLYWLYPVTKKEEEMEANVHKALDTVPLVCMQHFSNHSKQFLDAYQQGLNGKQAAWASKRYQGHQVLPEGILKELDKNSVA
ncbi:hypothetical protein F5141DRAFT_1004149, partial [Pisolithus sp. B1]